METSTCAYERSATPAPTLLIDKNLHISSALDKDKLLEGPSMKSSGYSIYEPAKELQDSNNAHVNSDQISRDQPATSFKASATSSGPERKLSLGEDSATMTIEFLRARLLSERSISKSAKQQSEQLAKKVMELEKNLLVEMEKRKLSQIAAEQALTKLESAGVHLDSTQLDIFVREHDSKKEAPVYQDKDSTADFSQPQQCMDSYLESQRSNDVESSYVPKINGQNKDLNEAEVDQNHLEPQSNLRALELDEVKDEERDSPCPLSETKALYSQALSSASQNQRVFPVRGIGRSCRTFKKKYTRYEA